MALFLTFLISFFYFFVVILCNINEFRIPEPTFHKEHLIILDVTNSVEKIDTDITSENGGINNKSCEIYQNQLNRVRANNPKPKIY